MSKKFTHGDVLEIHSKYVDGDLVQYKRKPPGNSRDKTPRNEYSRIKKVYPVLVDGNVVHLKFKMENDHVVDFVDIVRIEKGVHAKGYVP